MADLSRERPCIHVCLVGTVPGDLDRWVEVGAEEEGIPTRSIVVHENTVIAAAYAAAQSSRIDVGVAISAEEIVLHEVHMPPHQPVLSEKITADPRGICRRMGGNAARLVARLPFRFTDDNVELEAPKNERVSVDAPAVPAALAASHATVPVERAELDENNVKRIIEIVTAIVRERGMQ